MSRRSNWRKAARRPAARSHSTHSSFGRSLFGRTNYARRLRLEPLEDRRLLAVVTVTTLTDTVDFNDGVISLREAIFATNTVPGADTIDFAPALTAGGPATILLTQGELAITDSLTIDGPGADVLTIDASGNDPTPDVNNGDGSRIFHIENGSGAPLAGVSIRGVTLTGGDVRGSGGAIFTDSKLDISDSTISGNSSFSVTLQQFGGGGEIYARGTIDIARTKITGNLTDGFGGGLYLANISAVIVGQRHLAAMNCCKLSI